MRKIVITASAFTLFVNASAFAQTVPALRQGENYISVSNKLIKAGWQRDGGSYSDCAQPITHPVAKVMCKKFPEFSSASIDGYCKFIWRNIDGKLLGLSTYPCVSPEAPGPVLGWGWE